MISVTTTSEYLPNPVYSALNTVQANFSLSHGLARRFQPDVIPFAAVPELSMEALTDLAPLLTPGEEIFLTAGGGEIIPATEDLAVVSTIPGLQMRFQSEPLAYGSDAMDAESEPTVVRLTSDNLEEMLAFKERAFPGYFGRRAPVLGEFFGIRDAESGRLIAMGGERLATHTDREISAVCTDPDYLGRGLAARIMRAVLRYQASLGTGSFLHVIAANQRAISLYERLGFSITGLIDFVKLRRL